MGLWCLYSSCDDFKCVIANRSSNLLSGTVKMSKWGCKSGLQASIVQCLTVASSPDSAVCTYMLSALIWLVRFSPWAGKSQTKPPQKNITLYPKVCCVRELFTTPTRLSLPPPPPPCFSGLSSARQRDKGAHPALLSTISSGGLNQSYI